MADSENWDGRAWGTSTSRKFSEVIDNRPLRIRTVGGVEGAEDQKSSPLSDLGVHLRLLDSNYLLSRNST